MEAILSCIVTRTLNTIWDTMSKLNTGGGGDSQEIYVEDGKRDKESVPTGVFLPHKEPFCSIEGPSIFGRSRRTRRELGDK